MLTRIGSVALAFWVGLLVTTSAGAAYGGKSRQHLFVIERNTNANIVVYDLVLKDDGTPRKSDPIDAYWMRFASTGKRMELRWLEKKMAYGVDIETKVKPEGFGFELNAVDDRLIRVKKVGQTFRAVLNIKGVPSRLEKIYVAADTSRTIPRVSYIELHGRSIEGGSKTYEKIVND